MEQYRDILLSGLEHLNLTLSESQITLLLQFIKLIEKWNKAYNLTAIRNSEEMVRLHLLDSLAIIPYLDGERVLDIGTGAGLPGIPLAIARPNIRFTLLDSNAKKTRFVQQAMLELKLSNVAVCHERVENFHPDTVFDQIIARAFTNLPDMVQLTRHLLGKQGVLLAMKGKAPEQELAQLPVKPTVIPLHVPGIEAERCLIKIKSLEQAEVR